MFGESQDSSRHSVLFNIYTSFSWINHAFYFSAVFVIGPGNAGILYQHHETVIGDTVDISLVKDAIKKIKKIQ